MSYAYQIGVDENGLGARLGPLLVTAVLARVDEAGQRTLSRKLPRKIRADLDDSKQLVSHGDVALGEAWARVLGGPSASPAELALRLSLDAESELRAPCPGSAAPQCWHLMGETFVATDALLARIGAQRSALAARGVEIVAVKSVVACTRRLNDARAAGKSRFDVDLHAMERLVLALRATAGKDVLAICGKVGGMADYSRYFGPLAGRLHALIEVGRARSAYRFPGLGELHFVRDADARAPLVMLASLVGKWLRELWMARIVRFHGEQVAGHEGIVASGYNDPVTARFVAQSALVRRAREIPDSCFERARDEA